MFISDFRFRSVRQILWSTFTSTQTSKPLRRQQLAAMVWGGWFVDHSKWRYLCCHQLVYREGREDLAPNLYNSWWGSGYFVTPYFLHCCLTSIQLCGLLWSWKIFTQKTKIWDCLAYGNQTRFASSIEYSVKMYYLTNKLFVVYFLFFVFFWIAEL